MIIVMSAGPFQEKFYLANFETGEQLEKVKSELGTDLQEKLIKWYNDYQDYISLNLEELEPFWETIDNLDLEGQELLKKISKEYFLFDIEKFYYFSLCRNFMYVINRDKSNYRLKSFNPDVK